MELYIKVMFWLYILGIACRAILLSIETYPRKPETRACVDVLNILLGAFFAFWGWSLVWG